MNGKPVFAATLEEIRKEFNLKRRRSAEVLVNSSLRKFNSHLAIMAIMAFLEKNNPTHVVEDDLVADIFAGLYRSGNLKKVANSYLHGRPYGT